MKCLLIDVYENRIQLVDCNGLDDDYKYIKCNTIDIVQRKIHGYLFRIILDDNGALKDNPKCSATNDYNDRLYGNLLICSNSVIDGDLQSIELDLIHVLMSSVFVCFDLKDNNDYSEELYLSLLKDYNNSHFCLALD